MRIARLHTQSVVACLELTQQRVTSLDCRTARCKCASACLLVRFLSGEAVVHKATVGSLEGVETLRRRSVSTDQVDGALVGRASALLLEPSYIDHSPTLRTLGRLRYRREKL